MKIFNHVQIKVRDLKTNHRLYDAFMDILDYPVVLDIKNIAVGYGTSVHDMFKIRQFDKQSLLSHSIHLAFNALNTESVDAFYHTASTCKWS